MKKLFLFILVCVIPVYGAMAEKRFSAAFAYNASWQTIENIQRAMFAPGIAFSAYTFFDSVPVGFWSNFSFHTTKEMKYGGRTIKLNFGYPLHFSAGITFRVKCAENLLLLISAGLHGSEYICLSTDEIINDIKGNTENDIIKHMPFFLGIGAAGCLALNIELTNWLFIDAGALFAYDFISTFDNYGGITFIPYIGLGIKI